MKEIHLKMHMAHTGMVKACVLIALCKEHRDGARSMERGSGPGAWASYRSRCATLLTLVQHDALHTRASLPH